MTSPPEQSSGYSWTQPLCDDCWSDWANSEAEPVRARGEFEVCCHCGKPTDSGIYIRVDPLGVYGLLELRAMMETTRAFVAFVTLTEVAAGMVERGEAPNVIAGLAQIVQAHAKLLDQVREILRATNVEPRLTELETLVGALRAARGE